MTKMLPYWGGHTVTPTAKSQKLVMCWWLASSPAIRFLFGLYIIAESAYNVTCGHSQSSFPPLLALFPPHVCEDGFVASPHEYVPFPQQH